MEALGLLFHGFAVLLTWKTLVLMMVGLVLGIFVGVLPGLGGPNGVAILLPLTFTMDPTSAIVMLSCIYWGALFGGAITSILFNIPGEAWSVATTFDGYPMAQQGRAAEALTAAFTSSFIGSLVAVLLITFLAPMISSFALKFGPSSSRCICSPSAPSLASGARPSTRRSSRCRSGCCSPASAWTRCRAICA
ncbi:TctA family transporter [Bradyrhizobium niftali]